MPLFIFISGYFFSAKKPCLTWLKHKIKKLIIPYYLINFVFAIIGYLLYLQFGFNNLVKKISFYSLFIDPLIPNTLSGFNSSAWFLIVLFYIEIIYFFLHKLIKYEKKDIVFLICSLLIGLVAIKLSMEQVFLVNGRNDLLIKNILRTLCLFPYFSFGSVYKKYIEGKTKLSSIQSMMLIVCILIITYMFAPDYYGKTVIDYKQCTFSYLLPTYIVGICGILFWLHVSKLLSVSIGKSAFITILGNNTFSIMMYHLFGFFVTNIIYLFVNKVFHIGESLDVALFLEKPRNSVYGTNLN